MWGDPDTIKIEKLCESLINSRINIRFSISFQDGGNYSGDLDNTNIIGDCMEDILFPYIHSQLPTFIRGPRQSSPDFYNSSIWEWELKCFSNSPGFDISNFNSYISQLQDNLERKLYRTRYLIFKYTMESENIKITDFKLLNVWELINYNGKYPISIQCKRGFWYNIRPCRFDDMNNTKTPLMFINQICKAIHEAPNKIEDRQEIVANIYEQFNHLQYLLTMPIPFEISVKGRLLYVDSNIIMEDEDVNELRYVDLCSGIGGFRVALNNIKGVNAVCVLSADIKQDAIDTYNINFGEKNKAIDIYTLKPEHIPQFDLLCAGFPCQPFSSAGTKRGFSDKRGGMIFKIVEVCAYHRPTYVVLENVYNLLTLDNGKCIDKIIEMFTELNYNVVCKQLDSCDFGCAQSRERVYIVCTLNRSVNLDNINRIGRVPLKSVIDYSNTESDIDSAFVDKILELHKSRSVIGCKIGDKRGGITNIHSWDIGYNGHLCPDEKELMHKIMLNRRKKHWAEKKNIRWMDGMPLTYTEILTFYNHENLQFMLDKLVNMNYLRLEHPKDLIDGKRQYKKDLPKGYNICKGKLSFPISKILDPDDVSPTLTATDSCKLSVIINDNVIRRLTVDELKKICGFPDSFIIPTHVNYWDLFGNMATPPVLESIFNVILK